MTDLFISYSSHDRPWAERLFHDLKRRFPTIKTFWDRDPASIPPGELYRPHFEKAARNTTHFVVFWSAAAKESDEVGPEIQAFIQNVSTNPKSATGATRRHFYIPLEGKYGPFGDYQGYPDFQDVYKKDAPDRGISGLDIGQARTDWDRRVGEIGRAVLSDQATMPIILALLVMTNDTKDHIDKAQNIRFGGGPTLNESLQSIGLTLDEAKKRYDVTAFSWRPFGTDQTVIDLMERVREIMGRTPKRDAPPAFHWQPIDLVDESFKATDGAAYHGLIDSLSDSPSVVVTDPISLFNPIVRGVFSDLGEYARSRESVILSISPKEEAAAERLYMSLRSNSVLDGHLFPKIPAVEPLALCGINVQHALDIERLIRGGLGYHYLKQKKDVSQPLLSGV